MILLEKNWLFLVALDGYQLSLSVKTLIYRVCCFKNYKYTDNADPPHH